MASLNRDSKGWKISYKDPLTKDPRSLRPGADLNKKGANEVLRRVELLIVAKANNLSLDVETALWLAGIGKDLRAKLHRAGLVEAPAELEKPRLKKFVDDYITSRTDVKPKTILHLKASARDLVEFFGEDKPLADITEGDAEDFRRKLLERMGDNTTRRRCGRAKQFFNVAIKKRLLSVNPFRELKSNVLPNPKRFYFITRETATVVLNACPNAEWRLLFALARFGGLRIPSEIRPLKWEGVNWERGRLTIISPKTEHHPGGDSRVIPLFPELVEPLEDLQEITGDGEYVFTRVMREQINLSSTMTRIITRAGEKLWPKLFQNLRSTRQTELEEQFPSHVVCSWIGNSVQVARDHYLQTTDDHFAKAIRPGGNQGGNIPSHLAESEGIKEAVKPGNH